MFIVRELPYIVEINHKIDINDLEHIPLTFLNFMLCVVLITHLFNPISRISNVIYQLA